MNTSSLKVTGASRESGEHALARADESDDKLFYDVDRMVNHLDTTALATVEDLIGKLIIEERPVVLDLMAGWDSHIPEAVVPGRVVGLGKNERELAENRRLTETVVHDLNTDPVLPFSDAVFDVVLNVVSVDYLVRPVSVFREVARVLKPGGLFLVVFSNRMFPQKATRLWMESTEDERVELVRRFFQEAEGFGETYSFESSGKPRPKDDKYAHRGIPSDPVYAVYAEKKADASRMEFRNARLFPEFETDSRKESGLELSASDKTVCPHCGSRLKKYKMPDNPFNDWDLDYLLVCANDECPYLVNGWKVMRSQGSEGMSYRYMVDPVRGTVLALPIINLNVMKDGIIDD